MAIFSNLLKKFTNYLTRDEYPEGQPMLDFERMCYELRPADVLLFEGESRVSRVIKTVTQSSWSHAGIYIGRIYDIENKALRDKVKENYDGPPDRQLMVESILGKGTIVTPVTEYKYAHIRICRAIGISRADAQHVMGYAIGKIGYAYDVRQIFDLLRFLLPWRIIPRKWATSLFQHHAGPSTKAVCSTMIAEAFGVIKFPILPILKQTGKSGIELIRRNPRIYTPRDFDYSPYFEIIKYPLFDLGPHGSYRDLPWSQNLISNDFEIYNIESKQREIPEVINEGYNVAQAIRERKVAKGNTAEETAESEKAKDKNQDINFL